ncbi:hypothetical protein ACDH70_00735 [Xanthomonas axonopodis pv. poinsettiicola]|uniref:hypothetical protein n=1 Tax=Xanthomonas TaxID=338 RepID=UPI001E316492|nr:hypothetical protein [Xanthomonas codiaei]MCC8538953.1 hypothetical protein [Xanthomonas codiaei]
MARWAEKLISRAKLNAHSGRGYVSALTYWNAWHELRYGFPLPLAETPPLPVSGQVVTAFFCDHMVKVSQGQLALCMAEPISKALAKCGFNGRRVTAARATTEARVNILRSIQRVWNLPFDDSSVAENLSRLQASFRASQAALGHVVQPPVSLEYLLTQLVSVCTLDEEGDRDAALIVLVSYLSSDQAAYLRMADLLPGRIATDAGEIDVVEISLRNPETKYQRLVPRFRLFDEEAITVKRWGATREHHAAMPDAPFFTKRTRVDYPVWLNEKWITRRLRLLTERAGLLGTFPGAMCTPKKMRLLRENASFEQALQTRVGRAMGIGICAALNNIELASNHANSVAHRDE